MKWTRVGFLVVAIAVVIAACGGGEEATAPAASNASTTSAAATSAPTTSSGETPETTAALVDSTGFASDVLPIIENTCARCHTGDGPGTPHLRLDTVGDAIENSEAIVEAVGLGFMPPWPASALSVAFEQDWSLTEEEQEALVAWARRPLTDLDPDTPIVTSAPLHRLTNTDIEIAPEVGYDGEAGQPDEYRCFIYDARLDEDVWVRGYEFVPDQVPVVHHAIGYVVPGRHLEAARELDAANADNGGWPCFGSSVLPEDEMFLGWAPGQGPTELPDGTGMLLSSRDFLVIQVHYHYEVDAPEDFSSIKLDILAEEELPVDPVNVVQFLAPAEIPCTDGESGPLCDRDAALAAARAKYGDEGVQANFVLAICRQSPADFADMTVQAHAMNSLGLQRSLRPHPPRG